MPVATVRCFGGYREVKYIADLLHVCRKHHVNSMPSDCRIGLGCHPMEEIHRVISENTERGRLKEGG